MPSPVGYLLDTNVCIQFLRQRHAGVVQRIQSHQPSELRLCSIVVAELYYGSERSAQAALNRTQHHRIRWSAGLAG